MPLIRPEAQAILLRWLEPALVVLMTTFAANMAWRAASRGAGIGAILGMLALAIVLAGGALWLRAAVMRARLSGGNDATRVYIEESRLLIIAPLGNLQLAIDDIDRIAIAEGRLWMLFQQDGPPVIIPRDAVGASALADALSALPGFSAGRALAAMGSRGMVTIWTRAASSLAPLGHQP